MTPFGTAEVAAKFNEYPPNVRRELMKLRELIFEVAKSTRSAGEIEETLKWGEPAYLTRNRAGSTIRVDWKNKSPRQYAMYFNCKTNLVETFRTMFPSDFKFEGNRAIVFELGSQLPRHALRLCIAASLTYHTQKRLHGHSGA